MFHLQAGPNGIPKNQLIETSGGNIQNCKKIYHVSIPRYSEKEGIPVRNNCAPFFTFVC